MNFIIKNKTLFLALFVILSACQSSFHSNKTIKAIYFSGQGDFSVPISKSVFLDYDEDFDDTVCISLNDYNTIKGYALSGLLDTLSDVSGARIFLEIEANNYMIDNKSMLIGNPYKLSANSLHAQYLIKDKIGYYDTIDKEYLNGFEEIRIYGIPRDYHHIETPLDKPKKEIRSVLLIVK